MLRDNGSDEHYPTSAMEALTCLPQMELLYQSEPKLAALRLWSLGSWYLHPNRGHGSVLMRIQKSDPTFSMESMLRGQHLISNPTIGLLC